eukprot:g33378.t1
MTHIMSRVVTFFKAYYSMIGRALTNVLFYTISILKILFRLASNFPFPFIQTQLSNTIRTNLPSQKHLRRDLTLNSNLSPCELTFKDTSTQTNLTLHST